MPLSLSPPRTLPRPTKAISTFSKTFFVARSIPHSEAAMSSSTAATIPISGTTPPSLRNYPTPLSPPLPAISKDVELARAMSAASRSSLFAFSRSSHVLYEDQWMVAVDKPVGVYCEAVLESLTRVLEGDTAKVGRRKINGEIGALGILCIDYGLSAKVDEACLVELHLANRLDRDTSGVMVITKSHKVAAKLVKAFTNHEVRKTYIALCVGPAPKWKKITVKSGHGRSKFGAWRVYAASDVGRSLPGGSSVRDMETSFEVLSVNGEREFKEASECKKDNDVIVVEDKAEIDADGKDEILVRAFPRSGRTHQIRLHCQYLGISIKGDVKYHGVHEWKGITYDGHELHAESLSFQHPVTGVPLVISTPLPLWATQALKQ